MPRAEEYPETIKEVEFLISPEAVSLFSIFVL